MLYCKCWKVVKNVSTPCGQHCKQKTGGGQGWDRTIEQLRRWFRWKVTTVPVQVDSCCFVEQLLCILARASASVGCESRIWARNQLLLVSNGPNRPIKITSSRMADQDLVSGLSKLVGYSIVLPAFFVLIPQILKVSIMWPYMIENSTISRFAVSKSFCRTWCFHQVWEAGSGEGLSIALQAQELAMLVIGCQEAITIDHPCPCCQDDYYHLHPSPSTV